MKSEIHSNHRLIVRPDVRRIFPASDQDAILRILDDMATAVRRHVDCVLTASVEYDKRFICSHCGYEWETATANDLATGDYEGMVVGEPLCCDKAAAEFRAELRDAAEGR
jgi:hypothetical protein